MNRRSLVRWLVAVAIGVPVAIELLTFAGMLDRGLLGPDGDAGSTPTERPVGVGGELLPETPEAETLVAASVRTAETAWTLRLEARVENTGDADYEFRFADASTDGTAGIAGGGSTGRIPPGGTATAIGRWRIPPGSTPEAVEAIGIRFPAGGGDATTVRRTVPLAKVPVSRG